MKIPNFTIVFPIVFVFDTLSRETARYQKESKNSLGNLEESSFMCESLISVENFLKILKPSVYLGALLTMSKTMQKKYYSRKDVIKN